MSMVFAKANGLGPTERALRAGDFATVEKSEDTATANSDYSSSTDTAISVNLRDLVRQFSKGAAFEVVEKRGRSVFDVIGLARQCMLDGPIEECFDVPAEMMKFMSAKGWEHFQSLLGIYRGQYEALLAYCQLWKDGGLPTFQRCVTMHGLRRESLLLCVGALMIAKIQRVFIFTEKEVHVRCFSDSTEACWSDVYDLSAKTWTLGNAVGPLSTADTDQGQHPNGDMYFYCDAGKVSWLKHKSKIDTVSQAFLSNMKAMCLTRPDPPSKDDLLNDRENASVSLDLSRNPFSWAPGRKDEENPIEMKSVSSFCPGSLQLPPFLIQKWFVATFYPKNGTSSRFVGITPELLNSPVVVKFLFGNYWTGYSPQYIVPLECWLPNLLGFERKDLSLRTNETTSENATLVDYDLFFNTSEQSELLESFGVQSNGSLLPLSSLGGSFADIARKVFTKFELKTSDDFHSNGIWWPRKLKCGILDFTTLMERTMESFNVTAARIRSTRRVCNRLCIQSVIADTFRVMKPSFDLSYNTGASIYAEPTQHSAMKLNEKLSEILPDDFVAALALQEVLIADLGAGTGTIASCFGRLRNCPILGIEYCKTRCLLALHAYLKSASTTSFPLLPFKVAYLPMNILDLQSLEPPKDIKKLIVYLGDEAFDETLLDKIANLLKQLSVACILITSKAGRHKEYSNFWESKGGFLHLGSVRYTKRGGNNEVGQYRIYSIEPTGATYQCPDPRVVDALKACGNQASDEMRLQYYSKTIEAIHRDEYPLTLFGSSQVKRCTSAALKGERGGKKAPARMSGRRRKKVKRSKPSV